MEIETWEEDFSLDLLCIRNDKTLNHWNMILFFATGHLSRPESTLGGRIVTEEGRRVLFAPVYGQDLSSWKGEDGHDWNMIMSATALKREDTYIHTYVRVTRHGKPHKRRNSGNPLSRCSPSQGVWPGLYYDGMHPDGKQGGIYVGNTVG